MLFSGVSARRGTTMASGKVEGYKRTRLCEKCQKPPPTGVALLYCEHCEVIGYCSEECKKEHRAQHEQQCGRLASTRDRTVTAYKNCGVEVNCYEAGSFPGCPHPPPRGRPPTAPPAAAQQNTIWYRVSAKATSGCVFGQCHSETRARHCPMRAISWSLYTSFSS
jgi:hypothetical protein